MLHFCIAFIMANETGGMIHTYLLVPVYARSHIEFETT